MFQNDVHIKSLFPNQKKKENECDIEIEESEKKIRKGKNGGRFVRHSPTTTFCICDSVILCVSVRVRVRVYG
jgi:hypothetical protein